MMADEAIKKSSRQMGKVLGRRSVPTARRRQVPGSWVSFGKASKYRESVVAFDAGPEWWSQEITETVQAGRWDDNPAVFALEFFVGKETLGFAFLVSKHYGWPTFASAEKKYVRYIYTAGINLKFRGKPDRTRATVAETMFRVLEGLPRGVDNPKGKRVGVVEGMFLQVYVENERAIAFYEKKLGYARDASWGEETDGTTIRNGHALIALRKPLPVASDAELAASDEYRGDD
jgi:hypothetical protein